MEAADSRHWDPFRALPAGHARHIWIGTLAVLHGLGLARAASEGRWGADAYGLLATGGFGLAFLIRRGGLQLLALGGFFAWWLQRWWLHPFGDLYLWGLLGISFYVLARAIAALQREGSDGLHSGSALPLESWPETASLTRRERRLVLGRALRRLPRIETGRRVRSELSLGALLFAVALVELWLTPDRAPSSMHLSLALSPLVAAAASARLAEPLREILAREILPEFWKQPWLWDRARREALRGRAA